MNRSFSRALKLLSFLGLVVFSLQPNTRVDAALDLLLAPSRLLAELAQPVLMLGRSRALAAENELRRREPEERGASELLRAAQRRFALPTSAELRAGRQFCHAEVVGRSREDLDEIHIALAGLDATGIEAGMPVTIGDVYVGRVRAIDEPWPGHARVEIVTGRHFNVGARLEPDRGPGVERSQEGGLLARAERWSGERTAEAVRLVVGGLVAHERGAEDELLLAVRAPSRREDLSGLVRIDESLAHLEPFAREANGFRLGHTVPQGGDYGLLPELDYEAGLSRVVVVLPDDGRRPPGLGEDDPLTQAAGWISTRRLSAGDSNPQRSGIKIAAGRWGGVESGSAVAFGARLLGRIGHSAALFSDVRTLADRGFDVIAVAVVDGLDEPLTLGRLTSEGSDADGRIVFRWPAIVPLAQPAPGVNPWVAADIFTGAGESGVPTGLLIGRTLLPRGPGPHRLWIEDTAPSFELSHLWVRRSHRARMQALAERASEVGS